MLSVSFRGGEKVAKDEVESALALADTLDVALANASGSFDQVIELCEKLTIAQAALSRNATRQRIIGQSLLADETFKKSQKLAEYRLRCYRIIGAAWRDTGERRGRPRKAVADGDEESKLPTLGELGITKQRMTGWALASEVSDKEFVQFIADANANGMELTLGALVRIAQAKRKAAEDVRMAAEKEAAIESLGDDDQIVSDLGRDDFAGVFRTFYIDPPWGYDDDTTTGAAAKHYQTMGIDELIDRFADSIKRLAHKDGSHMWLWATWPKIRDGWPQKFIEACGFEWKSEVVWDKVHPGPGRWIWKQTEILIFAVRGKLSRQREDLRDLVEIKKGSHSRKPAEFYELVESFSPGPFIEFFARDIEEQREGWWYHGNEARG